MPASEVVRRVASEFKDLVDVSKLPDGPVTVVNFPGMRGSSTFIVDSKSLQKALEKAKVDGAPIVIVAHGFTQEARELLASEGAIAYFKSDFFWTDESWKSIHERK